MVTYSNFVKLGCTHREYDATIEDVEWFIADKSQATQTTTEWSPDVIALVEKVTNNLNSRLLKT